MSYKPDARELLEIIADCEAGDLPNPCPDEHEARFFAVWTVHKIMVEHTPAGTSPVDVLKGFAILANRSPCTEARALYARQLDAWAAEEEEAHDVEAARAFVQWWIKGETPASTVALWTAYAAAAGRPGPEGHPGSAARLAEELRILTLPVPRRAASHLRQVRPSR